MNPMRSVGVRLAAGVFVAVIGALSIVYLILVPSLQHRLTSSKLARLDTISRQLSPDVPSVQYGWNRWADDRATKYDTRVVLFTVNTTDGRANVSPFADSQGRTSSDVENDPVAAEAATTAGTARGTVRRNETEYAEVGVWLPRRNAVLMLSTSLRDALGTIDLVQRRLLEGGLVALLAAVAFGFGAASMFGRRIRRLERAADRIASGKFDEPVVDTGGDELGQLASAFERMRQRLGQLDNARREFIANASHELRTPIFSLSGFLELIEEEDLDSETRGEFLAKMREQVDRLARLATDLLDLSRLDAGRLHVEAVPLDLAAVAEALGSEFGPRAHADGRELEVVDGEPASALADEQRVGQIGRILVENALVHTPRGAHVRVATGRENGRALLSVSDDGPGIPPDKSAQVFERFYRVDGAVASGSGLGLAIARDLAVLMRGEIRLESRPGRTVFTLVLPGAAVRSSAREAVFTGNRPQA